MAARGAITIDEFELLAAALAENSELIDGELVDFAIEIVSENDTFSKLMAKASR